VAVPVFLFTANQPLPDLSDSLSFGDVETVALPQNTAGPAQYIIDWGDGSTPDTIAATLADPVLSKDHTYAATGDFSVSVTQTFYNADGSIVEAQLASPTTVVQVTPLAPTGVTANWSDSDNGVDVDWSVPDSDGAARYLIQRSDAGGDWATIATITAADALASGYQFLDTTVGDHGASSLYRALAVGADGGNAANTAGLSSATTASALATVNDGWSSSEGDGGMPITVARDGTVYNGNWGISPITATWSSSIGTLNSSLTNIAPGAVVTLTLHNVPAHSVVLADVEADLYVWYPGESTPISLAVGIGDASHIEDGGYETELVKAYEQTGRTVTITMATNGTGQYDAWDLYDVDLTFYRNTVHMIGSPSLEIDGSTDIPFQVTGPSVDADGDLVQTDAPVDGVSVSLAAVDPDVLHADAMTVTTSNNGDGLGDDGSGKFHVSGVSGGRAGILPIILNTGGGPGSGSGGTGNGNGDGNGTGTGNGSGNGTGGGGVTGGGGSGSGTVKATEKLTLKLDKDADGEILQASPTGKQYLVPLVLGFNDNLPADTTLTMSILGTNRSLDLWDSSTPGAAAQPLSFDGNGQHVWTIGKGLQPKNTYFLGAAAGSTSVGDIQLALDDGLGSAQARTKIATAVMVRLWYATPDWQSLGSVDVTGNTRSTAEAVLIGDNINIQAAVDEPAAWVNSTTYGWDVSGQAYTSYVETPTLGQATKLASSDEAGQAIQFYWIGGSTSGEDHAVRCVVTVQGKAMPVNTHFDVFRPTLGDATLKVGVMKREDPTGVAPKPQNQVDPNTIKLTLTPGPGMTGGMDLTADVEITGPLAGSESGTWYVTQLISPTMYARLAATGVMLHRNHNGERDVLDGIEIQGIDGVFSSDSGPHLVHDSPSIALATFDYVGRWDVFNDFVMFKPDGGHAVPLGTVQWIEGGDLFKWSAGWGYWGTRYPLLGTPPTVVQAATSYPHWTASRNPFQWLNPNGSVH
jgi:hypothetical protein